MSWLDSPGFARRPVVFVEDHLYHTAEALHAMAARESDLLSLVTVCAIDRPGPDTDAAVSEWLERFPAAQLAAVTGHTHQRLKALTTTDLASLPAFSGVVASLLRPGGLLVQDVQLTTLPFVPADRWWQSIFVATTVRGILAARAPAVRFLSNKRGYAATFGRDLADAGFDPRDVLEKSEVATVGAPALATLVDRLFPRSGRVRFADGPARAIRVANADRPDFESVLDVVLWPVTEGVDVGGNAVKPVTLRAGSHEMATWAALVDDRLAGGAGLSVLAVGERVGPPDAERAELTNLAARHIHTVRSRLRDAGDLATVQHAYRLAERVSVARVTPHLRPPSR
jgi:hypothetical protein